MTYFVYKMLLDNFSKAIVESLTMFVEDHCVSVSVEFLKTETAVVLLLNLLDSIFKETPDAVHIFFIHRGLHWREKITTK